MLQRDWWARSPAGEKWAALPHLRRALEVPWPVIHDMVPEALPMDVLVGIVDHGLNSAEEGDHAVGEVLVLEKTFPALEGDPQWD